jgi:hypothetical protein
VDKRYGHVFVNNLMAGDMNFKVPFLTVGQHPDLCGKLTDSQLKQLDYNVIVKDPRSNFKILARWSPVVASAGQNNCEQTIESFEDLKKVFAGSSANSQFYGEPNLQVFQSRELGNYQLLPGFKGSKAATVLPGAVQKLLGLNGKITPCVGAYPAK